jgi:hypothetical protein
VHDGMMLKLMRTCENAVQKNLREHASLLKKLPLCLLEPQRGHQIRRFWGISSLICGRYQLDTDFFNRLTPSTQFGE